MTDPQNRPSFSLDRATYPAQKGGCCKPAKLTGFFLIKSRISSKYPIFAIFSTGVDTLPLEPEIPSSVCQTEHFKGLFEIQSCLHPHHTPHDLRYAEPGQIGHYSRPFPNSRSSSPHSAPIWRAAATERNVVAGWRCELE
jgi:hypothetical protein